MKKALLALTLSMSVLTGCAGNQGIDVNDYTTNTSNNATNTTQTGEGFVDSTLGSYDTGAIGTMIDFRTLGEEYEAFLDVPVDIDVMNLNDIMAFAQVNNMMTTYEDYLGQTVKVHGNYYCHYIEEMDISYHFLLLVDGTNCCQGILEFLMPEGVEYPTSGENLIVMGEYLKYTDDFGTYPYILVSDYLTY